MVAHIITIAQQKGGAGKTTLAAHLGVVLAEYGLNVMMLDVDPQGSLTQWHKVRQAVDPTTISPVALTACSGVRIPAELDRLKPDYDFIIIDSPPHADTEARNAIRYADLVIIPMQPSPLDLWATQATLKLAKQEKVPVKMVLNRVNPQARLSQRMQDEMKELSLSLFGNRVVFASALMAGKGVTEIAYASAAAKEMEALAADLLDYFDYELEDDRATA